MSTNVFDGITYYCFRYFSCNMYSSVLACICFVNDKHYIILVFVLQLMILRDIGFFLSLRTDWEVFMSIMFCIRGRSPVESGVLVKSMFVPWLTSEKSEKTPFRTSSVKLELRAY